MRNQNGKLPLWGKLAIGTGVLFVVLIVAIIWVGSSMIGKAEKDATDPVKAKAVINEIVQLKDPLPDGWTMALGSNLGFMKVASIRNAATKVSVTVSRYPQSMNQRSTSLGAIRGAKMEVTEEGEDIIAGHKARYVRGKARGGSDMCMEICCLDADNGDLVMIHSVELSESKFDRSLVDPIFKCINGFK